MLHFIYDNDKVDIIDEDAFYRMAANILESKGKVVMADTHNSLPCLYTGLYDCAYRWDRVTTVWVGMDQGVLLFSEERCRFCPRCLLSCRNHCYCVESPKKPVIWWTKPGNLEDLLRNYHVIFQPYGGYDYGRLCLFLPDNIAPHSTLPGCIDYVRIAEGDLIGDVEGTVVWPLYRRKQIRDLVPVKCTYRK